MAKGPDFTSGIGSYGPWPDNDMPESEGQPSPHYPDGYHNRAPAGCHIENPTDMWLDYLVYPDRTASVNRADADDLDRESRNYTISVGTVTGRNPGPRN